LPERLDFLIRENTVAGFKGLPAFHASNGVDLDGGAVKRPSNSRANVGKEKTRLRVVPRRAIKSIK
jgi:hypothetical protein